MAIPFHRSGAAALAALTLVACAGRSRTRGSAPAELRAARQVVVIASASIVEASRDAEARRRDDWSDAVLGRLDREVRAGLARRGLAAIPPRPVAEVRPLVEGAVPVIAAADDRAYGLAGYTHVLDGDAYLVPEVGPFLERAGADLAVIAFARSTVGLGALVRSDLQIVVLGRDGRMLWMNGTPATGDDLRRPEVLAREVAGLLDELPRRD